MTEPRKIAALVTVYTHFSHAEMIVGKILEGLYNDGKNRPNLELVSLYTDQAPPGDLSRALARKYGFTIQSTVENALTLGKGRLAVDGVLCIAEHGLYPTNDRGQILYPRRWLFDQVTTVFTRTGRVVPVFIDKHLSATWTDAHWIYRRARELSIPLLAGSSLPLTWRRPPLQLPLGCVLDRALQIGYGPVEGYGFHALEALQCMVERRKGGETGARSAQCLQGKAILAALERDSSWQPLLQAALARVTAHAQGDYRQLIARAPDSALFLLEYNDGLQAAVLLPNGWIYEGDGGGFIFSACPHGQKRGSATLFYLQQPEPFAHFAYLVKAIEHLVQTGKSPYPVERTLLTTGMLDAVMTSRAEKGRRVPTPHLGIRYQPREWPFATGPIPGTVRP